MQKFQKIYKAHNSIIAENRRQRAMFKAARERIHITLNGITIKLKTNFNRNSYSTISS